MSNADEGDAPKVGAPEAADAQVTASLRALEQLDDAELSSHVAAYEEAYRLLQDRLSQAEG